MTDKEAIGVLGYQLNMKNIDVYTPINYEAIETVLNLVQSQQEEIERLKKTELKTKGGGVKVTLEGLICLETKILDLETELNKKDTLINTMQAEFERLENLEDNTDMLKEELKKKDKIIDEMAKYIEDESTVDEFCSKENCYADDYENGHCRKCLNCIKEYFINKVKEEN